jgi:hypothetical protein
MRLRAVAPAALLAMLALAGCSAGSSSPSSSAAESSPSTSAAAPSTSDAPTSTSPSTTATTSRQPGSGGHGRHGVATAPAGLTPTAGYGTYELCQGTCTGSVPASLRRPLDLPADDGGPCPITLHATGPVSPREISAGVGFRRVSGSQWLAASVTWTAAANYTGPVLIRGEMLGGGALGFGTGATPYDELQLLDAGKGAPRVAGGGRAWVTSTRIRSGGCYVYQVDGTGFSELVVFRAVG